MNYADLQNPELQQKLASASSPEELLALAQEEGYDLTDQELEQIAGGSADWFEAGNYTCPNCGREIFTKPGYVKCPECGNEFDVLPGDK